MRKALLTICSLCVLLSGLTVCASAADYSFDTKPETGYYKATNYEDKYDAAYNYKGPNQIDTDIPEIRYGLSSSMGGFLEDSVSGVTGNSGSFGLTSSTPNSYPNVDYGTGSGATNNPIYVPYTPDVTMTGGSANFTELEPGSYAVTEITAPNGYVLDSTVHNINVVSGQSVTCSLKNSAKPGLTIVKFDSKTLERMTGTSFEVYRDAKLLGTYTTDQLGEITLTDLTPGTYLVKEVSTDSGHIVNSTPQQIELTAGDGILQLIFLNNVKPGIHLIKVDYATLQALTNATFKISMIHKVDAATGKGIYGVTFILYDSGKNPIGEYTSDQDGYVYIRNELTAGKYYIRELEAAEGYILDEQYKTVWVGAGKCSQITWKNTAVTGQIQIRKYAAEFNTVTGDVAGTELAGAVYEITQARSGSVVGYITTDAHADWKLCRDGDCLFLSPSFIHDFIQVQAGQGLQRFKPEIVQDQKIGFLQIADQLFIASVAAPDRQVQEQPAHFVTADGHARPAGFPPKGADQIGLSRSGRSGNQQVPPFPYPLQIRKPRHFILIQHSLRLVGKVGERRRSIAEVRCVKQPF